jgi:hypothetical protein
VQAFIINDLGGLYNTVDAYTSGAVDIDPTFPAPLVALATRAFILFDRAAQFYDRWATGGNIFPLG